jgi:hypothetical protein
MPHSEICCGAQMKRVEEKSPEEAD